MKRHHLIAATLVSAGLGFATAAAADCAAELDSLAGVSKDGTTAPLAEAARRRRPAAWPRRRTTTAKGAGKDGT